MSEGKNIDDLFNAETVGGKAGKKRAGKDAAPTEPAAASAPIVMEPALAEPPAPAKAAPPKAAKKTIRIIIDEIEGENNYVFVGLNGQHFQLMRGVEVDVPEGVLSVLNNAVGSRIFQIIDPRTGQREMQQRNFMRYPYRVVG